MASYILAHDLGTSGNKASLYDFGGRLVQTAFAGYETSYPAPNHVEQNPWSWWRAVCETSRELLDRTRVRPGEIAAVAFSGQMQGCVPVGSSGEPLGPALIWADQRAVDEARILEHRVGMDRFYALTGHRPSPAYTAAKIMWLRRHQPQLYARTDKFLQPKDFVIARLTGVLATDYSDASGTNLLDLGNLAWSTELLKAANIEPSKLPDLHASTHQVGTVTPEAASDTGLKAGTPVVLGGGDGACATVGAGVVTPGQAYTNLGSSAWIALAVSRPLYDPEYRTFNFVHLDAKLYVPCGTMQAAGLSYAWVRDALGQYEARVARELDLTSYEFLDLQAARVPPGSDGLLFLPYLMGERSPHWNPLARGCFIGLRSTHRKAHLFRAVLEGVALNLRTILKGFQRQASITEMRLIGGGARSSLWRQIVSAAYGMPILTPRNVEAATSLGAALAGGVGVGVFPSLAVAADVVRTTVGDEPDPHAAAFYDRWHSVFEAAYRDLIPTFERIAETAPYAQAPP